MLPNDETNNIHIALLLFKRTYLPDQKMMDEGAIYDLLPLNVDIDIEKS